METARISGLLEPFLTQPLALSQLEQISIYIDLLLRWNARINLTAIRKEEEIVTRHFGESLFLARHVFPLERNCHPEQNQSMSEANGLAQSKDPYVTPPMQGVPVAPSARRVVDIGSGAGFPGLPLKIWDQAIDLTLIESTQKKAAFLREVIRSLTLTNVNVSTERAESLAANPAFPRADVVTLRAVENFETILPPADALKAPCGRLAILIGKSQLPLLKRSADWRPPLPIPQSLERVLTISIPVEVGKNSAYMQHVDKNLPRSQ